MLNLADSLVAKGDDAAAERACRESLALYQASGHRVSVAICTYTLGVTHIHQGLKQEAAELFKSALVTFADAEYSVGISSAFEGIASLAASGGNAEAAARLVGAAEELLKTAGAILEPGERDLHDRTLQALAVQIDEAVLETWRMNGRAMRLDDAIACALDALEHLS